MKKTVEIKGEHRAIIGIICKQYDNNLASNLFEYDLIEAHQDLVKSGDFAKYKLTIPKQFKVLTELAAMNLGVQIDIFENEIDAENNCVTDPLHNSICLTDTSDKLEQERFDIRVSFGSVYIMADVDDIDRLRELCKKYTAELFFTDKTDYYVKCHEGGVPYKTFHFPALHEGKRPSIIVDFLRKHEGEEISKATLNAQLKIKRAATIGKTESVGSSVFAHDKASMAVLSYFFDFQPGSGTYNGPIKEELTRSDIDVFEKYSVKQ